MSKTTAQFIRGVIAGIIFVLSLCLLSALFVERQHEELQEETEETVEEEVMTPTAVAETEMAEGISQEERELVERVVAAESRGEPYIGMVAVAQCIKDRGDLWGMTYTEVVLQESQFAEPYEGEVSDLVKTAVHEVFDLGYRATEDPITHFANLDKCSPDWAKEKVVVAVIGGHTFMY